MAAQAERRHSQPRCKDRTEHQAYPTTYLLLVLLTYITLPTVVPRIVSAGIQSTHELPCSKALSYAQTLVFTGFGLDSDHHTAYLGFLRCHTDAVVMYLYSTNHSTSPYRMQPLLQALENPSSNGSLSLAIPSLDVGYTKAAADNARLAHAQPAPEPKRLRRSDQRWSVEDALALALG
jgi:hypothetical protein